jgi:flagellar hook-associated protein 1 FlgK
MSFDSVGLSALNVAQLGLQTAGHNIANASTPGYHRQEIIQSTNIPLLTGAGFLGQGAHVDTITRQISKYLETQLLQVQASSSQVNSYLAQVTPLDNALGSADSGLSPAIQSFFQAVNNVATDPASVPARQALISGGSALVSELQSLNTTFDQARSGLDTQIKDSVTLVNSYATQLANLNQQIALATAGAPPGQVPNDLLDQREELTTKLNQEVGTTTIVQSDGTASVFFGSGQTLVIENQAFPLSAAPSVTDPQHLDVNYQQGNTIIPIGAQNITGGNLGGILAFRDQILDPAQNSLGVIALGLGQSFNNQHELGQDLAGNAGGQFFTVPTPIVQTGTKNTGSAVINATIANVQNVTTSDYRVDFNGSYTITRLSDNTIQAAGITAAALAAGVTVDGVTYTLASGVANAGDSFKALPTREAAGGLAIAPNINTNTVAAAAPITASATLGNLGTGAITSGSVNSPNDQVTITLTGAATYTATDNTTGAPLVNPATGNTTFVYASGGNISFNGWTTKITGAATVGDTFVVNNGVTSKSTIGTPTTISPATIAVLPLNANLKDSVSVIFTGPLNYDVVDNTTGLSLVGGVSQVYNPSTGASLSFNGWSAKITGNPVAGDTFGIGPNVSGTTDDRNALALAKLQTTSTMGLGTTSYEGSYAQLVSLVGNKASELQVASTAQNALVTQTQSAQQSVSGVNLDEEAANLIRFQQAYQAAGKMMQISNTLFASILAIIV